MLAQIDSRQLSEWMAFDRIEGLGEERADFRAGQICATVANWAGKSRKEDSEPILPTSFMPSTWVDKSATSPEEDEEQLPVLDPEAHSKLIMAAVFGKVDDGNSR